MGQRGATHRKAQDAGGLRSADPPYKDSVSSPLSCHRKLTSLACHRRQLWFPWLSFRLNAELHRDSVGSGCILLESCSSRPGFRRMRVTGETEAEPMHPEYHCGSRNGCGTNPPSSCNSMQERGSWVLGCCRLTCSGGRCQTSIDACAPRSSKRGYRGGRPHRRGRSPGPGGPGRCGGRG